MRFPIFGSDLQMEITGGMVSRIAGVVATGNPGCAVQIQFGGRRGGESFTVLHPVQLLAAAYRAEVESQ